MWQRLDDYFRKNRRFLAAVLVCITLFFAWMLFGAGQRARGFAAQYDIKAPVVSFAQFVQAVNRGAYKGATLYIRGDGSALLIDPKGPAASVPDFVEHTSLDVMHEVRAANITVEGSIKVLSAPALPSQGQAVAAALAETIGRLGWSLLYIAMAVFMFGYLRASMGGMGGIFKRRFKTYDAKAGDQLPVRLHDVAGMEGPRKELSEIVEYLQDTSRFTDLGARPPKGVLLYGPPGNGKTLLAKAIAGEAGVPFIEQNASSFVNMFVGAGAGAVRELFREARAQSKQRGGCVVFVDEIDAMGGKREYGGHDERMQTLNALLAEMDGFADNTGIVVIAATNRLETLDTALLRPGRFDRKVHVPLPGVKARAEILAVHLRKLKRTRSLDVEQLAISSAGMSGADLANWVNEAAIEAARRSDTRVGMEHFDMARDRVLVGPRNFGIEMNEDEERAVAWHEAGHATVRHALGGNVDRVTIVPRGAALGVTFTAPKEQTRFTRESLEEELAVLMGGRAAEEIFTGTVSSGAAQDLAVASRMAFEAQSALGLGDGLFVPQTDAGRARSEERAAHLVDAAYAKAREVLQERREQVEQLMQALMDRKTVSQPFGASAAHRAASYAQEPQVPPPAAAQEESLS
jgi:cell division protease FtsH